jgi:hypothetical protein
VVVLSELRNGSEAVASEASTMSPKILSLHSIILDNNFLNVIDDRGTRSKISAPETRLRTCHSASV